MSEDEGERSFEPTQRRLDEARQRGEVPIGRDLLAAAALGGFVLSLAAAPQAAPRLGAIGRELIGQADRMVTAGKTGGHLTASLGLGVLQAVLPWCGLPALAVLLALVAQRALVLAPERLKPKLSRLSVLSGLQNRFGASGLVEFGKGAIKLFAVSILLCLYLWSQFDIILRSATLGPEAMITLLTRLLIEFLMLILAIQIGIGALDLLWQKHDHARRNRMTRREMLDEMKDSEGDPHAKAHRQARAREISGQSMIADVARANVVIVNPTHYAVALSWDPARRGAPLCVAKGVDAMAAHIREAALVHGVPVRSDPPTARALHATVEIGAEIPPEHYRSVAAAIRFADTMRRKARALGQSRRRSR